MLFDWGQSGRHIFCIQIWNGNNTKFENVAEPSMVTTTCTQRDQRLCSTIFK